MQNRAVPSIGRKINRETVVLLGWGRAILLQFAHPLVAAAIADHSRFDGGVGGYVRRARHTVSAMLTITFGSETEARAVIAQIN
ncbi:MAG TPA: oxygenase MpaB family protein, partial [Candidatus Acidoferrales bacterium]|nr:oxygenase MpaB family protein [Candidatus Acidoferrales bacterium]